MLLHLNRLLKAILFFTTLVWTMIIGFEWNNVHNEHLIFLEEMQDNYFKCLDEEREKLGGYSATVLWNDAAITGNYQRNKLMKDRCAFYNFKDKKRFLGGKTVNQIDHLKYAISRVWAYILASYILIIASFFVAKYTITGTVFSDPRG